MAKKRKTQTPMQKQYQKEIARIRKAYRRLEGQGYRIQAPLEYYTPKNPKRVTKQAISKLHKITPNVLRQDSTALDYQGHIQSGTLVFQERRSISAKKAAQTRSHNKWLKTPAGKAWVRQQSQKQWQQKRKTLDTMLKGRAKENNKTDIILTNVEALIERYDTIGAKYLDKLLSSEIQRYGRDLVAEAMENAPYPFIEEAQNIIFYMEKMSSDLAHRSLIKFADVITGYILGSQEQKEQGEVLEQLDAYTDS